MLAIQVLLVVIGVLAHFLVSVIKNGSDSKRYWTEYRLSTLLSLLGAVASTILLIYTGTAPLYSYLMAGYMSDSIFNKAPQK